MENQSNFEIAQQRLQRRARSVFYTWLVLLICMTVLTVLMSTPCCILSTMVVGLVTAAEGIQVYVDSVGRRQPASRIEHEMTWLYGVDWRDSIGVQGLAFARDRIRKRWRDRWRFALHLLLFIPVNGLLLSSVASFAKHNDPVPVWLIAVPAIWAILLLRNVVYAFPTVGMLRRRERAAAEAVETEIQSLQFAKQKRGEKAKRVVLADDGELVEPPESLTSVDENPHR